MKISELLSESKGYWHYYIRGKHITIYFNPEMPPGKRWTWRDDDNPTYKTGDGYDTKRAAYQGALDYANELSLQNA